MAKKTTDKKELAIEKLKEASSILQEIYQEKPTNPVYSALSNLETTIREIKKI